MKIAYLFDSGSNFNLDDSLDCFIVPMVINIKNDGNETTYLDNRNISRQELNNTLNTNAQITTSQPIIGQLIETIEKIYQSYDLIIAIPFSKHLSSTFATIASLQNEYGKEKFLVADTNTMCITGNWFLQEIKTYLATHSTINQEQLDKLASKTRENMCGAVIVGDTKRLIAGGRLKGLKGLIAKTLKLKLIIKFKGNLDFKDKSLSLKDAIDKTLKIIDEDCEFRKYGIKRCSILADLNNQEENEKLFDYIIEQLNTDTMIEKALLPGCVISHTGSNTLSILMESNRS